MKIWYGYGSEHSANLVLIGRFVSPADAKSAERAMEELARQVRDDLDNDLLTLDGETRRFTDGMLDLLQRLRLHSFAPADLEQFAYDYSVDLDQAEITVRTDEIDVSAFLKLMIDRGARVEIYSAHAYDADGSRRTSTD